MGRNNPFLIGAVLAAIALGAIKLYADHMELINAGTWQNARCDPSGFMMVGGNLNSGNLLSGTFTASTTSGQVGNQNYRGCQIYLNVTAASGTGPTLTISLQGKDPSSGNWFNVFTATTAVAAVGQFNYIVYPGATSGAATQVASAPLPANWRINAVIGGTTPSFTFTVTIDELI